MCLKPRMDYGLQNAVILLTNKRYITLARRLIGRRHFHMQPGSQANTQSLSHLHTQSSQGAAQEVPALHHRQQTRPNPQWNNAKVGKISTAWSEVAAQLTAFTFVRCTNSHLIAFKSTREWQKAEGGRIYRPTVGLTTELIWNVETGGTGWGTTVCLPVVSRSQLCLCTWTV